MRKVSQEPLPHLDAPLDPINDPKIEALPAHRLTLKLSVDKTEQFMGFLIVAEAHLDLALNPVGWSYNRSLLY